MESVPLYGGQYQSFPNDLGALQRVLAQLTVWVQDHRDSFPQIRARIFKSFPLRVRARQFFDERNIAFGHFHVYSRQFHLRHTLQSYQDSAARAARDLSHAPVWCIMV